MVPLAIVMMSQFWKTMNLKMPGLNGDHVHIIAVKVEVIDIELEMFKCGGFVIHNHVLMGGLTGQNGHHVMHLVEVVSHIEHVAVKD